MGKKAAVKVKCWEELKCNKEDCPGYKSDDFRCWLISGTHCYDEIQGGFDVKIERCMECDVFSKNMEAGMWKETLGRVVSTYHEMIDTIRKQEVAMLELSTPAIQVWEGVLAVPLIGTIDSVRAAQLTENLLKKIVETQSSIIIIDITGVPIVDTQVANNLIKTVQAARLLGADSILVGITPYVAQTLVHLGIDLGTIHTRSTLRSGLEYALKKKSLQLTPIDKSKGNKDDGN